MSHFTRSAITMMPFRSEDKARLGRLYSALNDGVKPHQKIKDTLLDLIKNHSPADLFDTHKADGAYLEIADLYRYWRAEPSSDIEVIFRKKACALNYSEYDKTPFIFLRKAMTYFHETGQKHAFVWIPLNSDQGSSNGRTRNLFSYIHNFFDPSERENLISGLLHHPYWDFYPDALRIVLNDPHTPINTRNAIQQRLATPVALAIQALPAPEQPISVERVEEIVAECQKTGDLSVLNREFKLIEQDSSKMVGDVLTHVNTAFDTVGKTFWEVREFVNAAQPDTYPYPLLSAPSTEKEGTAAGFMGRLREAFNEWRNPARVMSPAPKSLSPMAQYARVINASHRNIEQMDTAIASLYKLNRLGIQHADVMEERRNILQDYMQKHGERLAANDPIICAVITAADNLHRSVRSVRFVEGFTVGLAQRIIPVRESMAAAATGSTVLATLQTAKSVTQNEQWTHNFHRALEHMANAGSFITAELKENAAILRDVGDTKAAQLARSAKDIHETFADYAAELKYTGNPGIAMGKLPDRSPSPP